MENLPFLTRHAGGKDNLVQLDPDHPGFRDPVYRQRRDIIAQIALNYQTGTVIPEAPYTKEEHGIWRDIWAQLEPLHQERVCSELLDLQRILPLPRDHIPQLASLNPNLTASAGFRMEPVGGLVTPRMFLRYLGQRVFLSTQYIRHYSHPLYTPEPDVVHELVGHFATLLHPGIAELNRVLGIAAEVASDAEIIRLERVYWYTLEFGLVEERGEPKAFGAGLLSSYGELGSFDSRAELRGWDLDAIADTPYDPTDYQPILFVAPSFTQMLVEVTMWVRTGGWRQAATS